MANALAERGLQEYGNSFSLSDWRYFWRGQKSGFIALLIVFVLIMLTLPLASASDENLSFNYPSNVNFSQRFAASVEIMNFSSGLYDVKIDVLNSTGSRIADIYNGTAWKSTIYYILGAINTSVANSSSLDLNITDYYNGTASINVTIRVNGESATYKFGPYSLTVSIPLIQNLTQQNQTNQSYQNQTNQTNQTAPALNTCLNATVVNLTSYPLSMRFGSSESMTVFLNGSCYNRSSVKLLVYGEQKKVIANSSDGKITKYAECQDGKLMNVSGQNYNISVEFHAYSNCDKDYEKGNYSIALRICSPSGSSFEKYAEFMLNITFSANSKCNNLTISPPAIIDNQSSSGSENDSLSNPSNLQNISSQSKGDEKGDIVISKDEKMMRVSAYLFIAVLFLMIAYLAKTGFFSGKKGKVLKS